MFYTRCEKSLNFFILLSIETDLTINMINYDNIVENYTFQISRKKS